MVQSVHHLCSILYTWCGVVMSLWYWGAQNWTQYPEKSHQCWRKNHLTQSAVRTLPSAAPEAVCLFCHKKAHAQITAHQDSQDLFCKSASKVAGPTLNCWRKLFISSYRTLEHSLLNFLGFHCAHCPRLSRFLWMVALPLVNHSTQIIAAFPRVHSVPSHHTTWLMCVSLLSLWINLDIVHNKMHC